ncbi:MFS transporter [Micrococcus sp. IITD107]|uniref:MFS transporter n=1 Tax=Micrococcus sp. IITD107 TaxID=3342790 RepID=UPI0035B85A7E
MASPPPRDLTSRQVQSRAVRVLGTAQVFSGLGNGATLSLGSILAVDLSGTEATAGLVNTAMTLGSALISIPLAQLALDRGRRVSLSAGLAAGLVGQAVMVAAVFTRVFPLLLVGAFLVGFGAAVNLQARFAVTDLAEPERRGRALSVVVWAVTVGAVLGPNLVGPGAVLSTALGIPSHAGPFLISAAGMLVGWLIILIGLRPDPLLVRRDLDRESGMDHPVGGAPRRRLPFGIDRWGEGWAAVRPHPRAVAAVLSVVAAHGVMVGLMSMTPLHIQHEAGLTSQQLHAHPDVVVLIGFTLSLHVAGMYALSPVMGTLADRWGAVRTVVGGLSLLLAATGLTALLPQFHAAVVAGLILLGLGWSAVTVAGSTLLVAALEPQDRVPAQGFSDAVMSLSGALTSVLAGVIMGSLGYAGLSVLLAAVVIVALLAALRLGRQRIPDRPGPPESSVSTV